jgi:hypothetical protein
MSKGFTLIEQVNKCVDCEQYVRSPDKKEGVCVRDNALFVNNPTQACSFYKEKKKKTEKPAPSKFTCSECGESDHVTAHKVPGIEGFVCYRCLEYLKQDRPTVMSMAKVEDIKAKDCCNICGKYTTKPGDRRLLPNSDGFICKTCCMKSKVDPPNALVPKSVIYERFLVIEGRGAWPCTNVYTHDFYDREKALSFVGRFRPETCKLFRVSSLAPITLEELSLGYEVKVTSTHEVSETK